MYVRFLRPVDYTPQSNESTRCWGQLCSRASGHVIELKNSDGTVTPKTVCGPMVLYFPTDSTPDLPDDVAAAFIASGDAERCDGPSVKFLTPAEITADIQVQK